MKFNEFLDAAMDFSDEDRAIEEIVEKADYLVRSYYADFANVEGPLNDLTEACARWTGSRVNEDE